MARLRDYRSEGVQSGTMPGAMEQARLGGGPIRGADVISKQRARWSRTLLTVAAAAVILSASASCAPGGTTATPPGRTPGSAVVVASFNFPESELVAATYALALMNAGIPARLQPGLGPRGFVQQALAEGVVDVVPEYLGSALTSLEPVVSAAMSDQAAVRRELVRTLARRQLQVLQPAAAQDQNGLMVTRATAARLRLRRVSDLAPIAPGMVLGGRPECLRQPYCLPGLYRLYGLEFARFVPLASEHDRIDAIEQGVVDVVVTGTTDGRLASGGFVLLADDRQLQPAENIVPVVRTAAVARYGERLTDALDEVSARLTTDDLIFLNWRVTVVGENVLAEARAWLERQGILPEPG
jgi:osmoprotectant transport system substrate-binding protein